MVSRSKYAFCLNGLHYIYHLDWCGCPDKLGSWIVSEIKSYNAESLMSLKNDIAHIKTTDITYEFPKEETYTSLVYAAKHPRTAGLYEISADSPSTTIFVENVYIIDLDNYQIHMKCTNYLTCRDLTVTFPIFSIPDNWIQILFDSEDSEISFENSETSSTKSRTILTC